MVRNFNIFRCKRATSILFLFIIYIHSSIGFSQEEKSERKILLSSKFSIGNVFHNSTKMSSQQSIDYKFNYSIHAHIYGLKLWKIQAGIILGHYSKRYNKNIELVPMVDTVFFDFSNQSFPLFYGGIGLSLYKNIIIGKKFDINFSACIGISGTKHGIPDISQISNVPVEKNIILYNYLFLGSADLYYNFSEKIQLGFNLVYYKECFKSYYSKVFFPVKNNIYGKYPTTNFLAMPEFPNFSISPQISVKYIFTDKKK